MSNTAGFSQKLKISKKKKLKSDKNNGYRIFILLLVMKRGRIWLASEVGKPCELEGAHSACRRPGRKASRKVIPPGRFMAGEAQPKLLAECALSCHTISRGEPQ